MKTFLFFILICVLGFKSAIAQQNTEPINLSKTEAHAMENSESMFVSVEQMPEFIGGSNALNQFIKDNLAYPKQELFDKIEGTVYCNFIINKEGNIVNPKVIRGISNHPDFDSAALEILHKMPAWKPGRQGGKPVNVQFTIPIQFTLPSTK